MAKRINKRRRGPRQQAVKGTREIKLRDPNVGGQRRSGAGAHDDRRKASSKRACRRKVDY